jgi:hypothetical protein
MERERGKRRDQQAFPRAQNARAAAREHTKREREKKRGI